jgi:hypothetical protein
LPSTPWDHIIGLLQELVKTADKTNQGDAEDSADLTKFKQVKATGSGFVVANECLRLAKCTSHVNLAEACLPPEVAEER